jgi:glyoxylate reductase
MLRPKIFVTRQIPDCGLEVLRARYQVEVWPDPLPPPRDVLLAKVPGVAGILSLLSDPIDGEVMDVAGPSLKVIANFAVGFNNIEVHAARQRGIRVGNTPDVLTDATADIAVGLMLAAARRFQEAIDQVRHLEWRTWEPLGLIGHEMRQRTLGIIGLGRIGRAVAERLHGGWQMRVLYTARQAKPEVDRRLGATHLPLKDLLQQSDFVSVHVDLNAETRHLINAERLAWMKPNAILVNTSRGGVVDQQALFEALRRGQPFAAGLDVTDPEPLPDDHPLRALPNCLILPHIGSATREARDRMSMMAAENIVAGIEGQPLPFPVST